jgi:hypothetical protein
MVSLRTWFVEQITSQVEAGAEPVPFEEWLQQRG